MCIITLNGFLCCELVHRLLNVREPSGKTSCFRPYWHLHLLRQLVKTTTLDCEITNPDVSIRTGQEKSSPFLNTGLAVQCSQFWCAADVVTISPDEIRYALGNSHQLNKKPAYFWVNYNIRSLHNGFILKYYVKTPVSHIITHTSLFLSNCKIWPERWSPCLLASPPSLKAITAAAIPRPQVFGTLAQTANTATYKGRPDQAHRFW